MTVLAVLPGKAPERMELGGSLESMQKFVGGTIQAVYPFPDPVAVMCNDEGKLMGLAHNRALRDEAGNVYDILCGPFFICGLGEEDFTSLPEDLLQKYTKLFQHPELFLVKLTPKHIQDLYSELLRRGLSGTSVRYVHNNLHKAFDYGVKLQALPRNPAEMVTPPRAERFEANTLTPTEVVRLLETSRGTEVFWPILLAVSLGLRRGEVLALRWKDVDLDARQVFIRHSARCENLEVFTISETKTKSSRRLLCLPAYVADALRKRRALLEDRRRELGATYNEQDLVCFRETGTPFTSNALRHQYLKALEQAGLPAIRFHDLRHTFANAMLGANVPEKVVSAVLGHSGIQVTMDTYSHVNTAMQEKAVETMDKILNNLC